MSNLFFFVGIIGCQFWMCYHARSDSFARPSSISVLPTTFSTTKYSVHVGNLIDGAANAAACSSSSSAALQSSCNLRSAFSLCLNLITAVTCPSSGSQSTMSVTCYIVLPGMSMQLLRAYGSNGLDVSRLSTWAATCQNTQVSLSIASSMSARPAIISGDSSSAPLLSLQGIPFMDLTMENVTITGFGDGTFLYSSIHSTTLDQTHTKHFHNMIYKLRFN